MEQGSGSGSSYGHARAHTAEHIFARALQNITGDSIQVLKVEHADDVNRVYIRCKEINMDDLYKAMLEVNSIIDEERAVREHIFPSLDEARKRFKDLRAYDARISGSVRVIEIDGYDYSACKREHVSNSRECGFFTIKGISRERDVYRIEYLVGDEAKQHALLSIARLASVAAMLKANDNTLEATLRNMLEELEVLRGVMRKVTEDAVMSVRAMNVGDVRLYYGSFYMLDDETMVRRAAAVVKDAEHGSNSLIIFLNRKGDRSNVVIASSHRGLNSASLLRYIVSKHGGKGGGRTELATGYISTIDDGTIKQEVMEFIGQALSSMEDNDRLRAE